MDPIEWTADIVGQTLGGRYRVESVVGTGGMGAVFESVHLITGRRVAVKLLVPTLRDHPKAHKRFQIEAQAAAATSRRGVVDVIDFDIDDALGPYLVMELLEGESLERRIARVRPFDHQEALQIASDVLDTLEAVHEESIVHRDLKPANIFLARSAEGDEVVKVLDFGISRVLTPTPGTQLTTPGMAVGTPRYMAPEQAQCDPDVDRRADLYSVGAILYEMFSGKKPYQEIFPGQVLAEVVLHPPRPLVETAPGLDVAYLDLVSRAMERSREARWSSAPKMRAAIQALLDDDETLPAGVFADDNLASTQAAMPALDRDLVQAETARRNVSKPLDRSSSTPGGRRDLSSWPAAELVAPAPASPQKVERTAIFVPEVQESERVEPPSPPQRPWWFFPLLAAIILAALGVAAGAFVLGGRLLYHDGASASTPTQGLGVAARTRPNPAVKGSALTAELRVELEAARRDFAAGLDNVAEQRGNRLLQNGYGAGVQTATAEGRIVAETHLLMSDIFLRRINTPPAPRDPSGFASAHAAVSASVTEVRQHDTRAIMLDELLGQCALTRNGQAVERLAGVYREMGASPAYAAVMPPAEMATFLVRERTQLLVARMQYEQAQAARHGVGDDCSAPIEAGLRRVNVRLAAIGPRTVRQ